MIRRIEPPDWIVEILSDSTSKKDLNDKYDVNEESDVKEYWIIMPKERFVEVLFCRMRNINGLELTLKMRQ